MRAAPAPKRDIENNAMDGRPRKKPHILPVYSAVYLPVHGAVFYQSMALFFTSLWHCFLLVCGTVFYKSTALFFTTESDPAYWYIEEVQLCFSDRRANFVFVHYCLIVNLN